MENERWFMFVWDMPYAVMYGSSKYIAVARNVDEARALSTQAAVFRSCGDGFRSPRPPLKGEPDRVLPVPCAEFHEWEE